MKLRSTAILLYFVRFPEPGRVKTRLAAALGREEAARTYRALVERNLESLASLPAADFSTIVTFDPPEAEPQMRDWLRSWKNFLPQQGENLGERLTNAFAWAFQQGFRRAAALGSDTLGLRPEILEEACRALEQFDLVLGPARDGGYYLIGLSRPEPRLFEEIPWSTGEVLERTLERARERGLRYFLLEELEDLDEVENLRHPEARYPK